MEAYFVPDVPIMTTGSDFWLELLRPLLPAPLKNPIESDLGSDFGSSLGGRSSKQSWAISDEGDDDADSLNKKKFF